MRAIAKKFAAFSYTIHYVAKEASVNVSRLKGLEKLQSILKSLDLIDP